MSTRSPAPPDLSPPPALPAPALTAPPDLAALPPAVHEALRTLVQRGAEAHPELTLPAPIFARFLLARAQSPEALLALVAADLYLACAAAEGDARALAIFDERHLAQIPAYLARRRLPPDVIDEVRQRTRERLFVPRGDRPAKIHAYAGRGALAAWLRVLVLRVSENLRREQSPHDELDDLAQAAAATASPEIQLLRARTSEAFARALRDAFTALPADDRALFRLQFARGLSLDAIAQVLGVHRATVARRIAAARQTLFARVIALLGERLGEPRPEVERALGEWRSKLDISLSGLLRETDAGE
jgi:RNA polymerase sigma-70 factor (ECF subfamily)